MNIGPQSQRMLEDLLTPTGKALEQLRNGPRNPMWTTSGRVVELDSPAGGFEALRWMGVWQRHETAFLVNKDRAESAAELLGKPESVPFVEVADEAWRLALFAGYQKSLCLKAAAAIYRNNGMTPAQTPGNVPAVAIAESGLEATTLEQWEHLAESNLQQYKLLLEDSPGTRVRDYGRQTGSSGTKAISGVVTTTVVVIVAISLLFVAIAVLSYSGVFRAMAPNAWAAGEAARIQGEALDTMLRDCQRLPADQRGPCIEEVLNRSEHMGAEANQRRLEQTAATYGAIASVGRAFLPVALGAGALLLITKSRPRS